MMVWVPKHCQAVRAVPISKTSSWASPAALAPYRAAATGQGHRAGGPFKLYSQLSWSRAGSNSQKHWRVRAFPVRKTSSWAAPAAVAPYLAAATGPGHRAGGPFKLYSQLSLSRAGSDSQKHLCVRRAVPVRKTRTSSWASPTAVAPYLAAATGHGRHRAGGPFKLYSHLSQ